MLVILIIAGTFALLVLCVWALLVASDTDEFERGPEDEG